MKNTLTLTLLFLSGFVISQTEYSAYPATGKGVSSTFVTDYHALGINPANLGWRAYEDKKVTMGTTETSFSLYSDVLTRETLRTSLLNVARNKNVDHISREEALGYAEDFAKSDFIFNLDNNLFGIAYQGDVFGGIAFSIRTRATWNSNFNVNFSDIAFNGIQSAYFDSLSYFNGADTVMIANTGNLSPDSLLNVVAGHASVPLNVSELFNDSHIRLSWNREFHLGYGRRIINLLDDRIQLFGGIGVRYIQGIGYMDFGVKDSKLQLVSAFSPGFNIDYGLAALSNPSAIIQNAQGFFRSPVGEGWGFDIGVNATILKKLHFAASVTNVGQMTYNGNVYEAVDTALVTFDRTGLSDLNIAETVPDLIEESGLIKIKGLESYTVSLPGTFRMGGSIDLGEIAHLGVDMVAPFNDVPGSFNQFAWGIGGDIKLFKRVVLMAGYTGGAGYDNQVPIGINFVLNEGSFEAGISSRDAITFFKENQPTISSAFGFARVRF